MLVIEWMNELDESTFNIASCVICQRDVKGK